MILTQPTGLRCNMLKAAYIDRNVKIMMDEVANRLLMISTIGVPMCLSHPPSSCKILYNEATEESGDLIVRKMAPIRPLFCDFGD